MWWVLLVAVVLAGMAEPVALTGHEEAAMNLLGIALTCIAVSLLVLLYQLAQGRLK